MNDVTCTDLGIESSYDVNADNLYAMVSSL